MSYGNSAMLKDFKHFIQRMQTRHLVVPCALGFLLFAILILAQSDMWDGTIISYASATGQFHGIRRLTADTDLDSVLILFRFEIFIAKFFHISFFSHLSNVKVPLYLVDLFSFDVITIL